jgi:hypothetical protein
MDFFRIRHGSKFDPQRIELFIHWFDFAMAFYQSEKFFCFKDRIVNQSAEPYSKGICEHHEGENTAQREYVNRFLFIIFRMAQASLVPLFYRYTAIFTISSMARTSLATLMPSIYRYTSMFAILRMA